jgi:hypothetical protein
MQHRWTRVTLLLILLGIGIGSAVFLWYARQQSSAARLRDQHLDNTLDRMLVEIADLGAAQEAYVAPNQADDPWLQVVSTRLHNLQLLNGDLMSSVRTTEAAAALQTFGVVLESVAGVDARVRDYLGAGDELMASDLVFSDAREMAGTLRANLRAVGAAERMARGRAELTTSQLEIAVVGATAFVWLIGLALLVRVPRPQRVVAPVLESSVESAPVESSPDSTADANVQAGIDGVELSGAAAVCGQLARLTDAAALPAVLARAADVLDAPGLIIWIGAGDQLFAAMAHGYDSRVLSRLGAINRIADNATAQAWREAELRTVPASAGANGAIVAPLIAHDGCRGVLAVEVRHGRERNEAARAVASMFASQLAGLVGAWPAAAQASAERAS